MGVWDDIKRGAKSVARVGLATSTFGLSEAVPKAARGDTAGAVKDFAQGGYLTGAEVASQEAGAHLGNYLTGAVGMPSLQVPGYQDGQYTPYAGNYADPNHALHRDRMIARHANYTAPDIDANYAARGHYLGQAGQTLQYDAMDRGQQLDAIGQQNAMMLQSRRMQMGMDPSLARIQSGQDSVAALRLKQAADQNAAAMHSAAAGARGADRALALRDAQRNAALGYQRAGQDTAIAQLQEQRDAMNARLALHSNIRAGDTAGMSSIGSQLGQVRSGDMSRLGHQSGLANLTQQGAQFDANLGQRQAEFQQTARQAGEQMVQDQINAHHDRGIQYERDKASQYTQNRDRALAARGQDIDVQKAKLQWDAAVKGAALGATAKATEAGVKYFGG